MRTEVTFTINSKGLEIVDHLCKLFECKRDEVFDCLLFPFAVEILDLPAPPMLTYPDYMKYCQFIRDALSWKKRHKEKYEEREHE